MKKINKSVLDSIISKRDRALISGPFGSDISKKFFVDEGIPVIRGNNLSMGLKKFIDDGFVYVTKEKADELNCYAFRNDLIFTAAGTIGQVGIIPKNSKYNEYVISNKQIRATLDTKKIDVEYAYYWLSSPWIRKYLINNNKGSTVPLLSLSEIRNIPIFYSDINDQKRIVKVLSKIDGKLTNNNTIVQQLEAIAETIYDYWFLQFEFPNEEGKPYKSSGGKMVWNEELQREIPAGWDSAKLKDVIIENPKSKIKVSDVKDNGEIPFFTSGANILATSEPIVSGMNCYLNTGGNADVKYYYGEASYSTDTWCITAEDEMKYILPFILDKIKPSMDKVFFQGTGLRHLQKNLLREYQLYIPDEKVAKEFTKVVRNIFKQQHNLWKENKKLESLKQFLLPLLMNGQVSVGNSNKL